MSQGNSSKRLCTGHDKNYDNLEQVTQQTTAITLRSGIQDPVDTFSSINSSETASIIQCKNDPSADTIEPINQNLPENSTVLTQTSITMTRFWVLIHRFSG